MKTMKRITALIISMIMTVTVFTSPADAVQDRGGSANLAAIIEAFDKGSAMPDLGDIIISFRNLCKVLHSMTGSPAFSDKNFELTTDKMVNEIVERIYKDSGVDFSKVYKNLLPDTSDFASMLTGRLNIDIAKAQKTIDDISAIFKDNGQGLTWFALRCISVWLGSAEKCEIGLTPVAGSDSEYLFKLKFTYPDGTEEELVSKIYYDADNNTFHGPENGPALLGFSMDIDQCMTFTGRDVWQRKMGFCFFYDFFCYTTPFMKYVTQRIKFDYDSREWMIQLWKGRYFITNGAEVGVYTRPECMSGSYYFCASDEDMLVMSLDLYHGKKLIFSRDPILHWWVTGFAVSSTAYSPLTLTMVTRITMKDEEMLKAFTNALKWKRLVLDYKVEGLDVTITW